MNNLAITNLEHVFKALSYRTRLAILLYLLNGEAGIHLLSRTFSMPYKTVERNLIYLQKAGFIYKKTSNYQAIFAINNNMAPHLAIILNIIKDQCRGYDLRQLAKSLLSGIAKADKEYMTIWKSITPK